MSKPAALLKAGIAACVFLLSGGEAMAQASVQLTVSPQTTTLPDGQSVPMWGYTCGDALATPSTLATCTALNGAAQSAVSWQPPLITVPAGSTLSINLVNKLSFASSGATIPTSLVIDGQLGGGLGTDRATMPSPAHAPQGTTWPGTLGGIDPATAAITVSGGGAGYVTPPGVTISGGGGGSGATAVAAIANGVVTGVTVSSVGAGYTSAPSVAIDAPPCIINGTTCVQATASMSFAILQTSDGSATFVPPAQSDRVRSFATEVTVADGAAGKVLTWNNLRPGTYLIHSGTQPSIQHPMGLYGVLVVTDPAATAAAPIAYGTRFDKDVALLLSEIDPLQNATVDTAVKTTGFSDALVWDAQTGKCGDATVHTCYPPAVNYSPMYYLVNGVSFDRTAASTASLLTLPTAAVTGKALLRFVNAGLRLHVPSVVNKNLTLLAEDGNKLPGAARVQSSLSLPAGKTQDVTIQPTQTTAGTYDNATYAVFDRQLSLSTSNQRDGGMQTYITVGTGAASGSAGSTSSQTALAATDKTYYCVAGTTLSVNDPARGLLAGTVGANGLALGATFTGDASVSTVSVNPNGTFTYVPSSASTCGGTFAFVVNGTTTKIATIAPCYFGNVSAGCSLASAPVANPIQFVSNVATRYTSPPPGVMAGVTNPSGLVLTAVGTGLNPDGSFTVAATGATSAACSGSLPAAPAGSTCLQIPYSVKNAQGTSSNTSTATVVFLSRSNLAVHVWDAPSALPGKTRAAIGDYRWIIEEDKTFWIDPKCQINSTNTAIRPSTCPPLPVESLGYSFHTANMPVVAQGCVGAVSCEEGQTQGGTPVACDVGNGNCRSGTGITRKTQVFPSEVHLDPNKRYFISILPGDGVNPTIGGAGGPDDNGKPFSILATCGAYAGPTGAWEPGGLGAICGHGMGGAQIAAGQTAVDIKLQQTPLPTAKIAVFVFQDDNPLNGENDAGGGVDVLAPQEPGLAGFEIKLFDQAGGLGDATGQITYDMFNQPVSNALANQKDPITGLDACPINSRGDGLLGMIPTCPTYESDGVTLSPLAGQVVIANLYPGLYEVVATPAADRIARGEEWLQTNTLDGGKPHEAFIRPNEPGYFQEFGPGGFHVAIGFANPKVINDRKAGYCSGQACNATLNVQVTNAHMSRTPDQRTYSTETYDHFSFTQCYVSVGPSDGQDFAFQKCNPDGTASFTNMPTGVFKLTVFDQWNDIMLDGLVSTVTIGDPAVKVFPVTQWRTNLFTRTFIDQAGTGVSDGSQPGLALVNTNIKYRDGSVGFFNNTDLNGYAGFNEVFPFMNWLVVETTSTRFKPTGVHTVYDAGGPVDCSAQATAQGFPCTTIAAHIANTAVRTPLPADLRVPGATYCDTADCAPGDAGSGASTGTVFPPQSWGTTQGWQGLLGQNSFMEFGVKPFVPGENGGVKGSVIYASTRPFDDPSLSLQLSWEPGVPRVKVNLYSKSIDALGNEVLKLVDTTTTTSWDDWAQGFRHDAAGNLMTSASGGYIPNMNCPGQDGPTATSQGSPFFATLKDSKQWLDSVDPITHDKKALAYHSQFKCYDGWSQLNQIQPAPYDGMYKFPSITNIDPATGKPATTNCTICTTNPDDGNPMLPAGKYVVEVILPPGYELVKEEDKNILLGDVYIAPVSQQFAGFGNIFIMPDQAAMNAAYNPVNPGSLNKTTNLGANPRHEGDTGSIESFWPCVGAEHIVPDLNSLYPGAGQAAPFAGASRRLCDRKEVLLDDQASVLTKFFVFSSTHIAGHFTGTITNDFASEFDPFSPQFGEKFGPPNLPVGMRDFNGNEVARVYADQWGIYNGLYFSTYGVNPPNPTGYVPQMSIACMNDPGPIPKTNAAGQYVNAAGAVVTSAFDAATITDPAYNPAYSNFCYEMPFMPGFTAYMDTPVIPTQAFADGYNLPDSEYPNATPAVLSVVNSNGSIPGPWVSSGAAGSRATVTFTVSAVIQGDSISSVVAGATTLTGGTVTCNISILCLGTTAPGQNLRNTLMAGALVININNRTGVTGYSATLSGAASVTITAPVGSGAGANGIVLTVNQTGVTVTPAALAFAGGSGSPVAMGLTITALGDKVVQNPNFSGPNTTAVPYNQKTITRHYGFGARPSTCPAAGACPNATVGGVAMNNVITWNDTTIAGDVVATGVPACMQQRGQPASQCGELVITASNGKQSIDAITVTINGRAPWTVTEAGVTAPAGRSVKDYSSNFGRMGGSPMQTAIDSADPGDLIIVTPGTYRENLIMWKPVRLQGVGAASVTLNADAHPAGKMDQWRRQMNCVFGLDLNGVPNLNNTHYDVTGTYVCPDTMHQRVDRIPFEAIIGWDASGNGNLAQVLQEPTLMGAYEGAGITVLGRGVRVPPGNTDFWGAIATGGAGAFTDGSVYLTGSNLDCVTSTSNNGRDYGTSNFFCNPSRIDGMSIINSSQGGGGVFIHGWAHNLDVGNTRISGNHGTLAGAINLGNGETPDAFINDGVECGVTPAAMPCPPVSWNGYTPSTNAAIPFQFNTKVRIHNNMLYNNASIGDALFSGTPSGAGGITVSSGSDGYQIDHNWIAGNLSTGDGGGVQHLGLSFQGKINNNYVLFNQSSNPTLPTNGGGITILGANLDRTLNGMECGSLTDQDCPPGLGEGTGFGLVVDANLIMGNSAESGSGGGLRLQQTNGSELGTFPTSPNQWYDVTVTNNIIANNVAGWDGGGVSMQDALKVTFINNTVVSNDTTASAGVLFKTLGAINAASPPPGCTPTTDPTLPQNPNCMIPDAPHMPQPAGLVTMAHTPNLVDALGPNVTCPTSGGNGSFPYSAANNGNCRFISIPKMANDMFWQNRAFSVNVVDVNGNPVDQGTTTPTGTGLQSQQNLIALTPLLNQTATGQCPTGANYWDIGVRGDPSVGGGGTKLTLASSILTSAAGANSNSTGIVVPGGSPVVAQACNGARMPPEHCTDAGIDQSSPTCKGFNAPAGSSETTGLAQVFVFNGIKPTATVDEGHNWLNLVYGPLTLSRPNVASSATELMIASAASGSTGGAYSILGTSAAVNRGTNNGAPAKDFFGNARPANGSNPADIGAVEFQIAAGSTLVVANPSPLVFQDVVVGTGNATRDLVLSNNGTTNFAIPAVAVAPAAFQRVGTGSFANLPANCGATLNAGASCTIRVQWTVPGAPGTATGTVGIAGVSNSPVTINANAVAAVRTASVGPNPLAFGNWASTTTSAPLNLTVTNTGNVQMTGIAFGFGASTANFSRVTGGTFPDTAPNCGTTLDPGLSCTVKVQFAPTAVTAYSRNLTVAATTTTVTTSPVVLTGTGVASRAAVAVSPNPATITLMSQAANPLDAGSTSMTGLVTLTNNAAAGGSQVSVTGIAVTPASGNNGAFSVGLMAGPDNCTGVALAPGASCTVTVRFTVGANSARGRTVNGTIRFTDNATGSPQAGTLHGVVTP